MRTKALLCAAALLAAGVATSMAQSNVYSLNVVGYVNVVLKPGLSLIANPLDAGNNSVSNIFRNVDYTQDTYAILTWDGSAFQGNQLDQFDGTWGNPTQVLAPGTGFFWKNPTANPITNTFVGNVLQGTLTVPVPPGLNLVASKVPQDGFTQDLGLNPTPGHNTILLWDGHAFQGSDYDEFDSTWGPATGFTVDPVKGPYITNANGFFVKGDSQTTATFTRNFTVQ